MEHVTLKITGMTCGGCVRSVKKVLESVAGVSSVDVSLERGEARVAFDPGQAQPAQLAAAVDDAGYAASVSA